MHARATTNTDDTTVTSDRPRTWTRAAVRWLPTFVGFPLGGLVAKLIVGRIDDPSSAILGGAISGAILGLVQWIAVRRSGLTPEWWVLATAGGFAIGLGTGAAAVAYGTDLGSLATQGVTCGAAIGALQAVPLYRRLGRIALAWPALIAGLWALGWTITWAVGIDVEAQYTVFGSSGAIAVTALSSILAVQLARTPRRAGR